jgi:hypothetical protein
VTSRAQRPAVLTLTNAPLGAVVRCWLTALPAPPVAVLNGRHLNDTLVAGFADRVDALRHMDDALGGEAIHGLAVSELRVITRLIRTGAYSQEHHAQLHATAAELARLAGWAAFDSGQHPLAQQFWLVALRAAHEAGDRSTGANILRCMAEQAVRYGEPTDAVTMLRAARAGAGEALTATEKAVLAGSLAIAHAQVGDARAVRAEIAEAFTQIERSDPTHDPDHVYWCSRPTIECYAGKALLCIGDAATAVGYLRRSVGNLDATAYPRELVHRQVWLGMAHVDTGDVDRAVELGYQTIDRAGCVASENARIDALALCNAIEITGHPGATALAEHARMVLRPGGRTPLEV